jgi:hypothetical protein
MTTRGYAPTRLATTRRRLYQYKENKRWESVRVNEKKKKAGTLNLGRDAWRPKSFEASLASFSKATHQGDHSPIYNALNM